MVGEVVIGVSALHEPSLDGALVGAVDAGLFEPFNQSSKLLMAPYSPGASVYMNRAI